MAVTTLFFVAPLTGTMLLGGGVDPVGTGWDVVFFPMVTLIHLALLGLLARTWHEMERRPDDTGE
jgi:hypothetical protein